MSGASGPFEQPPSSGRRLRGDVRGQSETIGVVLILGMVVLGMTAVVAFGSQALDVTKEQSETERAEQAMAQFDSRAAQVALGDSTVQSVPLGAGGQYEAQGDAGWIRVEHVNYTESSDHDVERIYEGTLGAVTYRNGGTTIAYQGGGVWRKEGTGNSTMVSPPEFHYWEGTLTLPVIRASAHDTNSAAGEQTTVTVRRADGSFDRTFPSDSRYDGTDGRPYANPVENGTVDITVRSEYYRGWAAYFRDRTDGTVAVDPDSETVTLELLTLGQLGRFPMPDDNADAGRCSENVCVQGFADHSLANFTFTIYPKDNQQSAFKNLRWSLYVDDGNRKFEVAFGRGGGGPSSYDCGDSVPVSIYYSNDSHGSYQGWQNTAATTVDCPDGNRPRITLELTDETLDMGYTALQGSDLSAYKSNVRDFQDAGYFVAHDSHDTVQYAAGETTNASFILNHYFSLLGPDFEIEVSDQQGGGAAGVEEDDSYGRIEYSGGDRIVRYLHITENGVEIEFN